MEVWRGDQSRRCGEEVWLAWETNSFWSDLQTDPRVHIDLTDIFDIAQEKLIFGPIFTVRLVFNEAFYK